MSCVRVVLRPSLAAAIACGPIAAASLGGEVWLVGTSVYHLVVGPHRALAAAWIVASLALAVILVSIGVGTLTVVIRYLAPERVERYGHVLRAVTAANGLRRAEIWVNVEDVIDVRVTPGQYAASFAICLQPRDGREIRISEYIRPAAARRFRERIAGLHAAPTPSVALPRAWARA
jgi:hypothetical protein